MFRKVWKPLFIFLCGYLVIEWISIAHPFEPAHFFIGLVMHPLEFLAAIFVFFIGLLFTGRVFRELIHRTRKIGKKNRKWDMAIFFEYIGLLLVFMLLFQMGWEHTLVFFSSSLIYGIVSIEL